MNQNLAPGIRVRKSIIDGEGCFATARFCPDQQIAEYVGERIRAAEAELRRRAPGKKCICDIDADWSIDGCRGGNGTQYINHSCEPNSYLVITQGRIFLHALREITPGEEITADYLYELKLEQRVCQCGAATCLAAQPVPVIPQLAGALIRNTQEHRARLPTHQQIVQPIVFG